MLSLALALLLGQAQSFETPQYKTTIEIKPLPQQKQVNTVAVPSNAPSKKKASTSPKSQKKTKKTVVTTTTTSTSGPTPNVEVHVYNGTQKQEGTTTVVTAQTAPTPAPAHTHTHAAESKSIGFGLFGGLSVPFGDLRNTREYGTNNPFGWHVGGFVDHGFNKNHQGRLTLSYTKFNSSKWNDWEETENQFTMTQLGAEWLYHFNRTAVYSILGVSATHIRQEFTTLYDDPGVDTQGVFALKAGVGVALAPHFTLEGALNHASTSNEQLGIDNANWFTVSGVYHF